jgi:hypothetical protein
MKSSNRVLVGFGIGLVFLVIITIVLVYTLGQNKASLLPENTPEGVVQRYLQAIQNRQYMEAYGYLASIPTPTPAEIPKAPPRPTFEDWVRSVENASNTTWKASLGMTVINGDTATVEVIIEVFSFRGPFENPVRSDNVLFSLQREDDIWLITSPTYVYWLY